MAAIWAAMLPLWKEWTRFSLWMELAESAWSLDCPSCTSSRFDSADRERAPQWDKSNTWFHVFRAGNSVDPIQNVISYLLSYRGLMSTQVGRIRKGTPRLRKGKPKLRKGTPSFRKGTPRLRKGTLTEVRKRNTEVTKRNTEVTKRNTEVTKRNTDWGYEKAHWPRLRKGTPRLRKGTPTEVTKRNTEVTKRNTVRGSQKTASYLWRVWSRYLFATETEDNVRIHKLLVLLKKQKQINFKIPLQTHAKYYITQYEELGSAQLTQMKGDDTNNSHYLILTFLFKSWENVLN